MSKLGLRSRISLFGRARAQAVRKVRRATVILLCSTVVLSSTTLIGSAQPASASWAAPNIGVEAVVNRTGAWWRDTPNSWRPFPTFFTGIVKVAATRIWDPTGWHDRFGIVTQDQGAWLYEPASGWRQLVDTWAAFPKDISVDGYRTGIVDKWGAWYEQTDNGDITTFHGLIAPQDGPRQVVLNGWGGVAVITNSGAWIRDAEGTPWRPFLRGITGIPDQIAVAGVNGAARAATIGGQLYYTANVDVQSFYPVGPRSSTALVSMNDHGLIISSDSDGAFDAENIGQFWSPTQFPPHRLASAQDHTTSVSVGHEHAYTYQVVGQGLW